DDEVRVAGADLRTAPGGPLEPGLLDQAAGEVAPRVDENRTRVRKVERLGGAAPVDVRLGHPLLVEQIPFRTAPDLAARPREDGAGRKLAMAVSEMQIRCA